MSRPAHIAPLDAALVEAVAKVEPLDQSVREWLDKHGELLDEWDDLTRARADAYRDVHAIEDAIRDLGYVVLEAGFSVAKNASVLGDRTYSVQKDREEARARRAGEDATR